MFFRSCRRKREAAAPKQQSKQHPSPQAGDTRNRDIKEIKTKDRRFVLSFCSCNNIKNELGYLFVESKASRLEGVEGCSTHSNNDSPVEAKWRRIQKVGMLKNTVYFYDLFLSLWLFPSPLQAVRMLLLKENCFSSFLLPLHTGLILFKSLILIVLENINKQTQRN